MQIGYVGLGNMGAALAARLQLSYPLIVYDALENARNRLVSKGARAADSLEALAEECDRIFLCLPTSDQVRAVVLGEGGLRNYLKTGSLIIDQTTGDPRMTRSLASELAGDGVTLIDAPVSGGTQ